MKMFSAPVKISDGNGYVYKRIKRYKNSFYYICNVNRCKGRGILEKNNFKVKMFHNCTINIDNEITEGIYFTDYVPKTIERDGYKYKQRSIHKQSIYYRCLKCQSHAVLKNMQFQVTKPHALTCLTTINIDFTLPKEDDGNLLSSPNGSSHIAPKENEENMSSVPLNSSFNPKLAPEGNQDILLSNSQNAYTYNPHCASKIDHDHTYRSLSYIVQGEKEENTPLIPLNSSLHPNSPIPPEENEDVLLSNSQNAYPNINLHCLPRIEHDHTYASLSYIVQGKNEENASSIPLNSFLYPNSPIFPEGKEDGFLLSLPNGSFSDIVQGENEDNTSSLIPLNSFPYPNSPIPQAENKEHLLSNSQMDSPVSYLSSQRDKPILCHNGYLYVSSGPYKSRNYYRCRLKTCPARGTMDIHFSLRKRHNHGPQGELVENLKLLNVMKDVIKKTPFVSKQNVYYSVLRDNKVSATSIMPHNYHERKFRLWAAKSRSQISLCQNNKTL